MLFAEGIDYEKARIMAGLFVFAAGVTESDNQKIEPARGEFFFSFSKKHIITEKLVLSVNHIPNHSNTKKQNIQLPLDKMRFGGYYNFVKTLTGTVARIKHKENDGHRL